jgi:ankyrin repeat protein
LPAEKVQAVVGQSHRSLDEVRKLVVEMPLLVNACWDWGGGDFETPLEAAAHTGQRAIAEFLLAHGARPSLYAAAMLGQIELVKAFHAVDPKAHAIVGPHGFTVVHCAERGGAQAKPVVDWLLANGASPETNVGLKVIWPAGSEPKSS